jgi:hypothetical protein
MTKIKIAGAIVVVLLGVYGYLLFTGPRMYVQPTLQAYQSVAALPPPGSMPMHRQPGLPSPKEAEHLKNPIPPTAENLARGKVYYGYYCLFCHGEQGNGHGPVGESYVPAPADLHTAKIHAYSDGQLLRAMLTGTGHEPMLERIVLSDHRWFLARYVRQFAPQPATEKP